jgi:NAD(P)-dependent dehydrogenase (short-subunit alcohol dehydrogenase family)
MQRLKDRVAVVTGGASGNGRAVCERYLAEGATVVIADADRATGEATAGELSRDGGPAHFVHVDVTDEASVAALMQGTAERFGRLDVVVNNAGIQEPTFEIGDMPLDVWNRVIAVNLTGVFLGMKHAVGPMKAQGSGVIINMGSGGAGINGGRGMPGYCSTKAAVLNLTKCGALEYAEHGIRVNCIGPGVIDTPMLNRLIEGMEAEGIDGRRFLADLQPIRRLGEPGEIGDVALWLASDESSLVNGIMLLADGGMNAGSQASTDSYRLETA